MVSDKTSLQYKLLHECHLELDRRTNEGESGLRIFFKNELPNVGAILSKNEELSCLKLDKKTVV